MSGTNKKNNKAVPENTSGGSASWKPVQKKMPVVYIGPDFKNIITKNTIFKNGIPPEIAEKAGTVHAAMKLFVPLKDLPEAVKSIAQGGAYKQLYDNAVKEITEIDKGENAYE